MKAIKHDVSGNTAIISFKEPVENVTDYVKKEGYKLESGEETKGTYGKGNKIMQIIFGAFVKRFSFPFEIKEEDGKTKLVMQNGSGSKIAGGAIGVSKHNKEFKRIVEELVK